MQLNEDSDRHWPHVVRLTLHLRQHLFRLIGYAVARLFSLQMPQITRAIRYFRTGLVITRLIPAYVAFGTLKHLVPLRWLVRCAWCPPAGPRDREAERRLGASVLRLSQLMGLPDRDCFQRSLLLYRLLSRAGANPILVVGFRRMDGRILGHAWVIVDDHAIFESAADLSRFSPVVCFGARGALQLSDPMLAV